MRAAAPDSETEGTMDGHTFDTITRQLAVARSRRRAVAVLTARSLGFALGALGLRAVATQARDNCRLRLERCEQGSDCCEKEDVACRRLSRRCRDRRDLRRERCCGVTDATCSDDCDCCGGFNCRDRRCR